MKRIIRRRNTAGRKACFLLLLSLGLTLSSLLFSSQLTAAGIPVGTIKIAVHELNIKTDPAPSTLKDFVQLNMDKLSKEATFKSWKGAESQYYPLGPGTHGWLVNVMKDEQRIGYLIITAKNEGGYELSEYGAGNEGLPYSLSQLRQLLVQEGLISSSYSGTLSLTPLYSPILPLWEVTISGKRLYINAAEPEILPWNYNKAESVLKMSATAVNLKFIAGDYKRTPQAIYRTAGTSDPFENLLWITTPKLPTISDNDFSAVLKTKGNLVFQSAGRNDIVGGPLMISGYQLWRAESVTGETGTKNTNKLYAVVGRDGKRFVPLSLLQQYGTLHEVIESQ